MIKIVVLDAIPIPDHALAILDSSTVAVSWKQVDLQTSEDLLPEDVDVVFHLAAAVSGILEGRLVENP